MSGIVNYRGFNPDDTPSLEGKVAVVTGGNSGIGQEIVTKFLLHHISKVYILARSGEKFEIAKRSWQNNPRVKDVEARVEFLPCDLSDIKAARKVSGELASSLDRLDILCNNAGLPTIPDYKLSPQGIETIWATNVVGPFVLTQVLLPKLENTSEKYGTARIVITSSSFHMGCQELNFDLTMSPTPVKSPEAIDSCWRYARSKLGNILFTRELARRLDKKGSSKVYANCFFPGNVPTEAMDTWKELFGAIPGSLLKGIFDVVGQSTTQAAATAVYLATSPEVEAEEQKGKYFIPIATEGRTSKIAEDKDLARNLWYWCDDKVTKCLGKNWDEVDVEKVTTEG